MCELWNMTTGTELTLHFKTIEEIYEWMKEVYFRAERITSYYDSTNEKWYFIFRVTSEPGRTPWIIEVKWI